MTIFFSDTFPTNGPLSGQLPQVPLAPGLAWSDSQYTQLSVVGGSAVSSGSYADVASSVYGVGDSVNYGKPAPIRLTFTMKTPPNLGNVNNASHGGVQLLVMCGGIETAVKVWGYFDGAAITWYANINTATFAVITADLAPSTEYTGRLDISDGSQVFTFLGRTLSNTNAFTVPTGLNKISLLIWADSSVGMIAVSSNVDGNGDYVAPGTGSAALTAPSPILLASNRGGAAALTSPYALLAAFGGANAALTGTFPNLQAEGHDSSGENDFAGTAPMAGLVFAGGATARLTAPRPVLSVSASFTAIGNANLKAPASTLAATGTVPALANAVLTAPMASLVFLGGANGRLTAPSPALAITGTVTGWGSAALAAPSSQLTASGTVSAMGGAALVAPMASVIGYSGAVCSITLTGKPTLQATGTGGSVGSAAITCPLFELTASGTRQASGSANLLAPSPRMGATAQAWLIAPGATLTAIGTAVVTAVYEAYSVNLKHVARANEALIDEMTRYTNFPFDRIVRYQNSYFGVAADGLYLLEGTTDNGVAIACTLETHVDDFGVPEKKTVVSARIGGRFGPTATVTLHVGETGETAYPYTTPRGQLAQNHREKFGRGIKDRYFGLKVETSGALEIDQLELEINKLTRRI